VVSPGQSCLTVVAVASLRVQARFDESLLSRMRLGDAAQVWLKSQPDTPVQAQVVRLNRAVDADTREFSVDLRLAPCRPTGRWASGPWWCCPCRRRPPVGGGDARHRWP
jgi:hypothetical protein